MSRTRQRTLWYSRHRSVSPGELLKGTESGRPSPSALWIAPTSCTRDWWKSTVATTIFDGPAPTIWTWTDLWRETLAASTTAPRVLSHASSRWVLREAIARRVAEGGFDSIPRLVDTPGFRGRLTDLFAEWTREERFEVLEAPEYADPDDWRTFSIYLELLGRMNACDEHGLAHWASTQGACAVVTTGGFDLVAVLSVDQVGRAAWRVLEQLRDEPLDILLTLACDPNHLDDPACADLKTRIEQLRDWGFTNKHAEPEHARPMVLGHVAQHLFTDTSPEPTAHTAGIQVVGMPEGEGEALAAARAVDDARAAGAALDEIVIVVPAWTDSVYLLAQTLIEWGIPVSGVPARPLACDPAVACLLQIARLPLDEWDTRLVATLLRNRLIRPVDPALADPEARAFAACVLRSLPVVRGLDDMRAALEQELARHKASGNSLSTAAKYPRMAVPIIDELSEWHTKAETESTWATRVGELRAMCRHFGLSNTDRSTALETLLLALDDINDTLAALEQGDVLWTWRAFRDALVELSRALELPPEPLRSGTVRIALAADICGIHTPYRIVLNAREGVFPNAARVAINWLRTASARVQACSAAPGKAVWVDHAALAREMRLFLDQFQGTTRHLTIIYPSTDVDGQHLLRAAFLEELEELFEPRAWSSIHQHIRCLQPVLDEGLARSPREKRVRALSLALHDGTLEPLSELAMQAGHRESLAGTGIAMHVNELRARPGDFGPFEGMLASSRALRHLADEFERPGHALSVTQLESYARCPFQYFARYVLNLEPPEEHEEFQFDLRVRGRVLHDALCHAHTKIKHEPETADLDKLRTLLVEELTAQFAVLDTGAGEIGAALNALEREMLEGVGGRYHDHCKEYVKDTPGIAPDQFEVAFGLHGAPHPALSLGVGSSGIQVQIHGKIDRIDLVASGSTTHFRVIDYKSGHIPDRSDLERGVALQLPVYVLAADRLVYPGDSHAPLDTGHWALGADTKYKRYFPVHRGKTRVYPREFWADFYQRLEDYILALAGKMRSGAFPVAPREDDCESRCDFRSVCRIRQVRAIGKSWPDAPEWDPTGAGSP